MGTGGDCPHFLAASCGGDNTVKLWNVFTASGIHWISYINRPACQLQ